MPNRVYVMGMLFTVLLLLGYPQRGQGASLQQTIPPTSAVYLPLIQMALPTPTMAPTVTLIPLPTFTATAQMTPIGQATPATPIPTATAVALPTPTPAVTYVCSTTTLN